MTTTEQRLAHGRQLHRDGSHAAAERAYRQALQEAPGDANGWCCLGMALHDQGRYAEAVAAYRRALRLRPRFPVALNNMGNSLRFMGRLQEAVSCFDRAIAMRPDHAGTHRNKGTALYWEGFIDEALACFRRALELDPEDEGTHKSLGVIWLLKGHFADGWREYEWRCRTADSPFPGDDRSKWDGSPLDGRTICLVSEQGLGDTVHFIRYAAELKRLYDCRVLAAVQRPLLPLLATCAGVDRWLARDDDPPEFDCFAPLLSLPGLLRHDAASFPAHTPYLDAEAERVARWREHLAQVSGVKIGIAWQGSAEHQADRYRSVPLSAFAPLNHLEGVTLVSLQKGPGVEQLEEQRGRIDVVTLGEDLDASGGAFQDTAAVLKSLDLLITSDTAIAHVAGALGVPVWVALAKVPDWRWLLERDDSPWYPTMRLFRQCTVGQWADVFQAMVEALRAEYPQLRFKPPAAHRVAAGGFNRLTRARHGLLLYNRHDIYVGRSLELYGEYSEGEVDLFRQLLKPGDVVVEAGANIGAHTLPLSECVGTTGAVYAFEPQRIVFQTLCANVAIAGRANVFCRQAAVGARAGELIVPPLDYDAPNNFGGLGLGSHERGEPVPVVTVDSLNLSRCALLKADVEGMERSVLEGAAATIETFHPVLYVENDRVDRSAELIGHIRSLGYDLYRHTPRLFNANNYFHHAENVFGGVVSMNLLCVHSSVRAQVNGLEKI